MLSRTGPTRTVIMQQFDSWAQKPCKQADKYSLQVENQILHIAKLTIVTDTFSIIPAFERNTWMYQNLFTWNIVSNWKQ